jgi:hypothetical protein
MENTDATCSNSHFSIEKKTRERERENLITHHEIQEGEQRLDRQGCRQKNTAELCEFLIDNTA